MKKIGVRVMSLLLSVSLLTPALALPAYAVDPFSIGTTILALWGALGTTEDIISTVLGWRDNGLIDTCNFLEELGSIEDENRRIEAPSLTLQSLVYDWNTYYRKTGLFAIRRDYVLPDGRVIEYIALIDNSENINTSELDKVDLSMYCLCNENDQIIYSDETTETSGFWLRSSQADTSRFKMLSYTDLEILAYEVGGDLRKSSVGKETYWRIYCDNAQDWYGEDIKGIATYVSAQEGVPFAAPLRPEDYAVNQDRVPDKVVDGEGEEVETETPPEQVGIDVENMEVYLPTGDVVQADSILYDASTKTYYVDASYHEGDTYITNNYYYKFEYHINYTSITYIGQTEEYSKYYEVYYELPDGRSSADLTKEELEQLNVSMDVIPYGRSADDTSLRSLYHFDGDTRDSSYWNYCTDFTWNKGASLTYMDAGVFDGALYLDENEHDFTITLPSAIGIGDFTLQFRYYQSHTAAPQNDSYIALSSGSVVQYPLKFDGAHLLSNSGATAIDLPVGSWNEIALIRSQGIMYVYINGLSVIPYGAANAVSTSGYSNVVTFHFGSGQQTFKYLDELRVLNYALVDGGAYYEPTSVPHDTNLTLVLPDSELPVADEYWHFDTTIEPLRAYDFTDGICSFVRPVSFGGVETITTETIMNGSYCFYPNVGSGYLSHSFAANPDIGFLSLSRGTTGYTNSSTFMAPQSTFASGNAYFALGVGLNFPLQADTNYSSFPGLLGYSSNITFSVVLADGSVSSVTFNRQTVPSYGFNGTLFDCGDFSIGFAWAYDSDIHGNCYSLYLLPDAGKTIDIVYAEFVLGSIPNTGHEFVSSVTGIDAADLNTPTLAVRTDVTITSHQIGGSRPSVPTKGLVWALVEDGTIRSLQIYNGTAWEAVDGRIWTGSRWVPASSYNIITLQDLYDIKDATQDYEYIYTETGFWSWWQKTWNNFVTNLDKKLDQIIQALGGSTADGDITEPDASGNSKFTLLQFFGNLFTGVQEVASDVVGGALDGLLELGSHFVQSISDFFAGFAVMDLMSTDYFEGLGDTLGEASDLVGGVWDAVPEEVQKPLVGGFMLTVFGVLMRVV